MKNRLLLLTLFLSLFINIVFSNNIIEDKSALYSDFYKFDDDTFKTKLKQEVFEEIDKLQSKYNISLEEIINLKENIELLEFYSLKSNKEQASEFNNKMSNNLTFTKKNYSEIYEMLKNLEGEQLKNEINRQFFEHISYGYTQARELMFKHIDNKNGNVECVYTGRVIKTNGIPDNKDMNCEHTWPQSKGATGIAKTDIHHLFPTDSKANSQRSSWDFDDVTDGFVKWQEGGSKLGNRGSRNFEDSESEDTRGNFVFEPRDQHKGDVARAMFYFSTIYSKKLHDKYEETLRNWHKLDPVDQKEKDRNDAIESYQNNRNPFVDRPELVDKIDNF